ncbi:MAG: hypothetical protein KHY62_01470 [Firmicutes bacterium]|nr:hypothetical protein [Bacillota bacterium]
MARDYQRSKNNPWILPYNLYRQTLYAIRDYERLKEEYEDMLTGSAINIDGQPKGTKIGDPTGTTAARLEKYHDRLKAIEAAKEEIPKEYIKGVWQNIVYGAPFPHDADRTTYGRYKSKFVYEAARQLSFV